jgi:L-lactate utilization protein LutC
MSTIGVEVHHIAVVRASQVVADLVDQFELRPDTLDAASTTIITGPSKTADIEGLLVMGVLVMGVLVMGVHGPAEVEIVLVG